MCLTVCSAIFTKSGTLFDKNRGSGPYIFSPVTFYCLVMPYYGCQCRTLLYQIQCIMLHFEQYM